MSYRKSFALLAALTTVWTAAGLLGGCASSPPMHYYTLSGITPAARLDSPEQAPVRLDRVTIPTELDRAQIVRRIDSTRVQIVENDRWAAPLDDMIRRVLSQDLAARLPPNTVADPNEPSLGERRQSLSVDIQEFYGEASCDVTLRASWVLKRPDSDSSPGSAEAHVPSGGACSGVQALPPLMSQALAQLSDQIAAAVARQPSDAERQRPGDH